MHLPFEIIYVKLVLPGAYFSYVFMSTNLEEKLHFIGYLT